MSESHEPRDEAIEEAKSPVAEEVSGETSAELADASEEAAPGAEVRHGP